MIILYPSFRCPNKPSVVEVTVHIKIGHGGETRSELGRLVVGGGRHIASVVREPAGRFRVLWGHTRLFGYLSFGYNYVFFVNLAILAC